MDHLGHQRGGPIDSAYLYYNRLLFEVGLYLNKYGKLIFWKNFIFAEKYLVRLTNNNFFFFLTDKIQSVFSNFWFSISWHNWSYSSQDFDIHTKAKSKEFLELCIIYKFMNKWKWILLQKLLQRCHPKLQSTSYV